MTLTAEEKARHEKSLDASAEFARQVRSYMREKRIPASQYSQAAKELSEQMEDNGGNLHRVAVFGEDRESENDKPIFSWKEADSIICDMIKKRMDKGESFDTARAAVFSDPAVAPIVEAYTQNN